MPRRPASPRGKAFTCTWPRRRARAIGCSCTGWGGTGGVGGRLIMCVPGCRLSQPAIAQPPPTESASATGPFWAPWRVTDRVEIPPDAVSGYYEAKLEIVGGAHAGAVGSVPLILDAANARRLRPGAGAAPHHPLCPVAIDQWGASQPLTVTVQPGNELVPSLRKLPARPRTSRSSRAPRRSSVIIGRAATGLDVR